MRYDDAALFLKYGNGEVISTYDKWNIVCTAASIPDIKAKELPTHSYPEDDGEDTYIPSKVKVEAYDQEYMLAYKGDADTMNSVVFGEGGIVDWLTSCKNGFTIYDRYRRIGRKGCYFKSLTDGSFFKDSSDHFLFKLSIRVTNPLTNVELTYTKA